MKSKTGVWALLVGTRPEIIKMSPVIRRVRDQRIPFKLIHTGQHYSPEMDAVFFKRLGLSKPDIRLDVGKSGKAGHGAQTAFMLEGLEAVFRKIRPSALFIQGDTNTVLAGALAASKIQGIRIAHVEAGLRSYDRGMPEETNRVIADHLSDYLFAPTPGAATTLKGEGIDPRKIFVTGNTIADAVLESVKRLRLETQKTRKPSEPFILLTLHRQENVDDPARLRAAFEGVSRTAAELKAPVLFPMHPRTAKQIARFGVRLPSAVRVLPPADFFGFLDLESRARLILTDSGGVQEEACILRVPCVTLRTTTERPETIAAGGNVLAGTDPAAILRGARRMLNVRRAWRNPFGDGRAAERIVEAVRRGGER